MQTTSQQTVYHVISHTHWDREWYETFEQFRIKLVIAIDRLLDIINDNPDYIFHLDAQTIVLEDYREIRPVRYPELLKQIRQGRIKIGPWYIQNDFFLCTGEATIRNLLLGTRQARAAGNCDMVGYTPDQFGLPSQLPQIFRQFGIDSCVFARGFFCNQEHPKPSEFFWQSEDGSRILAVFMPNWYNNAQRFSENEALAWTYFCQLAEALKPFSQTPHQLLMNGVDHLEAQENLLPILKKLQQKLPQNAVIKQSTLTEYCMLVAKHSADFSVYQGPLRQGDDRQLLQGTHSSRTWLKAMNVEAESMLMRSLEPLCVMAALAGFTGGNRDADFLEYLWKLLITNHPHDSICGCSTDAVHDHMVDRYRRIFENIAPLLTEKMTRFAGHIADGGKPDEYRLTIFNPVPFARSGVTEIEFHFPGTEKVTGFSLLDENGQTVPYEIIGRSQKEIGIRSPINLPGRMAVDCFQIRIGMENLPPFGYRSWIVRPDGAKPQAIAPLHFENSYLKLTIQEGRIDVLDKRTGRQYSDLLTLEDTGDDGDSYSYRPLPDDQPISSRGLPVKTEILCDDAFESAIRLSFDFKLPKNCNLDTRCRSRQKISNPISITLKLQRFSPRLSIRFDIDNHACDHQLRALIHSEIECRSTWSDAPFDGLWHDNGEPEEYHRLERTQYAASHIHWHDGDNHAVNLYTKGLHAYEYLPRPGGILALTLLRATGYIASYEERHSDPAWRVPENQCLRRDSFEIALEFGALQMQGAIDFLTPFPAVFTANDPHKFSGGRPCVQDSTLAEIFYRPDEDHSVKLDFSKSFFSLSNRKILLVCVKFSMDQQHLLFRLQNIAATPEECTCTFDRMPEELCQLRLDESELSRLSPTPHPTLRFAPKEIITLSIKRS